MSAPIEPGLHPLARLFPRMDPVALLELTRDIAANGQREAIVTLRGDIVDGRNRWLACKAAGVTPRTREYDGDEAELLAWVVSQNLHRRHLTPSQRTLIAAEIAARLEAQGGKAHTKRAARLTGVDPRHLQYARRVLRDGVPEQADMVRNGALSVHDADKLALIEDRAEQARIVAGGAEHARKEVLRLGGGSRRTFAGVSPRSRLPERPAWADIFVPFGKPLGACDRGELEAALARQAAMARLLPALIRRLPPVGTVAEHLTPEEFTAMLREAGA